MLLPTCYPLRRPRSLSVLTWKVGTVTPPQGLCGASQTPRGGPAAIARGPGAPSCLGPQG